jgi:uncharacterized membrane protein
MNQGGFSMGQFLMGAITTLGGVIGIGLGVVIFGLVAVFALLPFVFMSRHELKGANGELIGKRTRMVTREAKVY